MAGDVLTRSNIIVRESQIGSGVGIAVSPVLWDRLTDGKCRVRKGCSVRLGQRVRCADVVHETLPIDENEVLYAAFGFRVVFNVGAFSGRVEVAVTQVMEKSPAAKRGLVDGDIITKIGGVCVEGLSESLIRARLIDTPLLSVTLETARTGRQHSSNMKWLTMCSKSNFRLITTAENSSDSLVQLGGNNTLGEPQSGRGGGSTSAIACRTARGVKTTELWAFLDARGLSSADAESMMDEAVGTATPSSGHGTREVTRRLPVGLLEPNQLRHLVHGCPLLTKTREGGCIYVVAGSSVSAANGWYRAHPDPKKITTEGGEVFVRRAPQLRLGGAGALGQGKVLKNGGYENDCYLIREPGSGWFIHHGEDKIFGINTGAMDPPPLGWSSTAQGNGTNPTVSNFDKVCFCARLPTRTPSAP